MSDRTDKRVVTEQQARELANELSINFFMETSAKVNEGVRRRFHINKVRPSLFSQNLAYTPVQRYQDALITKRSGLRIRTYSTNPQRP